MGNIVYMHTYYNTNYIVFLKYRGSQMCVGGAGWEQEQRRKKGGSEEGGSNGAEEIKTYLVVFWCWVHFWKPRGLCTQEAEHAELEYPVPLLPRNPHTLLPWGTSVGRKIESVL